MGDILSVLNKGREDRDVGLKKKAFCSRVWCLIDTTPAWIHSFPRTQPKPSLPHVSWAMKASPPQGIAPDLASQPQPKRDGFCRAEMHFNAETQGSCKELGRIRPPPTRKYTENGEKTQANEASPFFWMLRSYSQRRLGNSSAPASLKHIRPDYLCS